MQVTSPTSRRSLLNAMGDAPAHVNRGHGEISFLKISYPVPMGFASNFPMERKGPNPETGTGAMDGCAGGSDGEDAQVLHQLAHQDGHQQQWGNPANHHLVQAQAAEGAAVLGHLVNDDLGAHHMTHQ